MGLLLDAHNLRVSYGGIPAVKGVSFSVSEGAIVALLGANGAGKSTVIRAVSGIAQWSGALSFQGVQLKGLPAHRIQRMGLVHVPEGRKIFANLTVRENLILGAYHNRDRGDVGRDVKRVCELFPILADRFDQLGGTLSGGEQQMLAVGRALMSKPKLLMMDEPSLGLAPLVVAEVFRIIQRIRDEGVTILLVEQNARAALEIGDYGYILETGVIVLEGPCHELAANPGVKEAYLGHRANA
jgi:branched-chain amino acid transport system ATP-binding protein